MHMVSSKISTELRGRIRKEISSEKRSLSAGDALVRSSRMGPTSFRIKSGDPEIEVSERLMGAVVARFGVISLEMEDEIQLRFPITVSFFYQLAKKILHGEFGEKLQLSGSASEDPILQPKAIFTLLLYEAFQEEKIPEIFHSSKGSLELAKALESIKLVKPKEMERLILNHRKDLSTSLKKCHTKLHNFFIELKIPKSDFYPLAEIFRTYLSNLTHPSHLASKIQIESESVENRQDRSESILRFLNPLIQQNNNRKKIHLTNVKKLKQQPYRFLIDTLFSGEDSPFDEELHGKHVDEALQLAKSITEPGDRDDVLKNIAIGVAKSGDLDKALQVVSQVKNREKREYILASIVNILSRLGEFEGAKEIITIIREVAYREDAIEYIVKAYLDTERLSEGMDFVDTIKAQNEKIKAAKIILNHAVSNRDTKKIEEVREHFQL